jgi:uncharacterized protein YeaO (DUF488 family)
VARNPASPKDFLTKRVYEPAAASDGFRVLVDRLWPRGQSKDQARIDLWLKDIAPSNDLRRRFHGEPAKWTEFVAAYRKELLTEPGLSAVESLRKRAMRETVTLLYAARDEDHNNACALKKLLEE